MIVLLALQLFQPKFMPDIVGDNPALFEHQNMPWLTEEAQAVIDQALSKRPKK